MKRTLSIILLIVSCLVLIVSVVFCFYGVYDINRTLKDLDNDPSASGIDYFGIGWGYGICLFVTSAFGLILSGINKRLLQQKILRYVSVTAMVVFALLLLTSLFLFFM